MEFFVCSILGVAAVMVVHQVVKAASEPKVLTKRESDERDAEDALRSKDEY